LKKLPEEIGGLIGLKRLWLNGSSITSLPPSIGQLQNLEELWLCRTTNLQKLPEEIGGLIGLKRLLLNGSSITSLPPSFGQLQNLEWLLLSPTVLNCTGRSTSLMYLYVDVSVPLQVNELDKILLKVVQDCKVLGYIQIISGNLVTVNIKVGFSLACNRARSRTSFGMHGKVSIQATHKLWPLVLKNATRAFRDYPPRYDFLYDRVNYFEYEITNHDAIYHLLLDGMESLIGILLGRNK
jgi:hypothetical protein